MSRHRASSLSYSARREVLVHVAPRYQEATNAQKTLLLDQIIELTRYERKYAIRLLNHDPKGAARILRPRQPIYGSAVQEALFLAWRTIQYPCAQRLVPSLPSLIPLLERDGHLRLGKEHCAQLLTMSVRTAERLLSTQRRPTPQGFSNTKPGTLLKHQEQITFTRSRPECSNDNAHVEQKNGAVVHKVVGHDRLVSMLAYQQLGELYQAARILVNAFQPSMKLQSKHIEGEHECRIYDEAKTPLQRVLLSEVLPEQKQQEWREAAESLDPLRLVQHVEALQRAVRRCSEGGPGTTLVRFSLSACVSAAAHPAQRALSEVLVLGTSHPAETRDWSRSMDDPFLGEWEQIHAYVCTRPMASAGEILREWQRRFPERFVDAHLGILQRRLREIRAYVLVSHAASSVGERESAIASRASSKPTQAVSPLADAPAVVFPDPVSASSSLPPAPEEAPPLVPSSRTPASDESSSKGDGEDQHALIVQEASAVGHVNALLLSTMTIDHAIRLFLQGEHTHDWEPKTREWHETSLGQLQRYFAWRGVILLSSLTCNEIRGWLTFLRTEALVTGAFRMQSTISTYARSAHACCAWLVGQEHLE